VAAPATPRHHCASALPPDVRPAPTPTVFSSLARLHFPSLLVGYVTALFPACAWWLPCSNALQKPSSNPGVNRDMEFDERGHPLRRRLLSGFLDALPLIEDDADAAYLPLGEDQSEILSQARAAYSDYIANHDAGDASVGATAGATNTDGFAEINDGADALPATTRREDEDGSTGTDDGGAETVPRPSPVVCVTPRRRAPRSASTKMSTPRIKTPRPPSKLERPHTTEELVTAFLLELRVALDLDARMPGDNRLEGGCAHGAKVIVFVETFDPIATWTALMKGKVEAFCSCGGVMGSGSTTSAMQHLEHVEVQWARKKSSTCRHAAALLAAYGLMASEVGVSSLEELLSLLPALEGPSDGAGGKPGDTVVHFVVKVGKRLNIPMYVTSYVHVWAPAILRPGGNRYKLATCCLLSCQTQPWGCPHAKAVSRHNRIEATAVSEAAAEAQEALRFGPGGVLNEMGGTMDDEPVAVNSAPSAEPVAPPEPRRARNMFPCSKEVAHCEVYGAFVDAARAAGDPYRYDEELHVKETCIVCQAPRGISLSSTVVAMLYTARGRMQIRVGEWVCPSAHVVKYDGSADGLFAATPETVYTRVFLDLVLEICVIARSTLASSCQNLTSLLRNTAAYGEGEPGKARQLLSNACGEFSDTLVVPAAAFKCHHCGHEDSIGRPFRCIVCDGQMLSVLQANVKQMIGPGGNAPRVDFSILFACAVRTSSVRGVVRRRVRAKPDETLDLTVAESRVWPLFVAAGGEAPPPAPPLPTEDGVAQRSPQDNERALKWSTSKVFQHFFEVVERDSPAAPAPGAAPAAALEPAVPDASDDAAGTSADEYDEMYLMSGPEDSDVAGNDSVDSGNETDAADTSCGSDTSRGNATDVRGAMQGAELPNVVRTTDSAPERGSPSAASAPCDGSEALVDIVPPRPASQSVPSSTATSPSSSSSRQPILQRLPPFSPSPSRSSSSSSLSFSPGRRRRRATNVSASPSPTRRSARRRRAEIQDASDPWGLEEGEVEHVPAGADASADPVAVNRADPLSPLTQRAIKVKSDAIVAPPDGVPTVIVKIGPVPLQHWDFLRTKPSEWFNDELVNGYVELLRARQLKFASSVRPKPRYIFFSSFFYDYLVKNTRYNYNAVKGWTRNDMVLKARKIFIPVNTLNAHWFLVVVEPAAGRVELYDSLGGGSVVLGDHIARWANQEAGVRGLHRKDWKVVQMPCMRQENSDDCGVFTCRHMDQMSKGEAAVGWGGRLSYHRRRIAAELLSASL